MQPMSQEVRLWIVSGETIRSGFLLLETFGSLPLVAQDDVDCSQIASIDGIEEAEAIVDMEWRGGALQVATSCSKEAYGAKARVWCPDTGTIGKVSLGFSTWQRWNFMVNSPIASSCAAWSKDGKYLATSVNASVGVYDLLSGRAISTYALHHDRPIGSSDLDWLSEESHLAWALAFSPDDQLIAIACSDRSVRIVEAATGKCLHSKKGKGMEPIGVEWSPRGRRVAYGQGLSARIWSPYEKEAPFIRFMHDSLWIQVSWSPDGECLATGCGDGVIRVWAAHEELLLRQSTGIQDCVAALAWSHDGKWIAAGGVEGVLVLLRSADLSVVAACRLPKRILKLAWSETDQCLAVALFGGVVVRLELVQLIGADEGR